MNLTRFSSKRTLLSLMRVYHRVCLFFEEKNAVSNEFRDRRQSDSWQPQISQRDRLQPHNRHHMEKHGILTTIRSQLVDHGIIERDKHLRLNITMIMNGSSLQLPLCPRLVSLLFNRRLSQQRLGTAYEVNAHTQTPKWQMCKKDNKILHVSLIGQDENFCLLLSYFPDSIWIS